MPPLAALFRADRERGRDLLRAQGFLRDEQFLPVVPYVSKQVQEQHFRGLREQQR